MPVTAGGAAHNDRVWESGLSTRARKSTSPVRWCPRCGLIQPPANFCRQCGLAAPTEVPPGFLPRQRTGVIQPVFFSALTIGAACMLLVVLLNVFVATGLDIRAIGLALSAAILPTLLYGALIVWL